MFRIGFVRKTAIRQMDVVEGIVTLVMFLHGAWLISPFSTSHTVSSKILENNTSIIQAIGLAQVCVTGIHLFALLRKPLKRGVIRRGASFFMFLLYIFYGASSLILFGLGRVSWVTTFGLAFLSGVVYLRLKREVSRYNARD